MSQQSYVHGSDQLADIDAAIGIATTLREQLESLRESFRGVSASFVHDLRYDIAETDRTIKRLHVAKRRLIGSKNNHE